MAPSDWLISGVLWLKGYPSLSQLYDRMIARVWEKAFKCVMLNRLHSLVTPLIYQRHELYSHAWRQVYDIIIWIAWRHSSGYSHDVLIIFVWHGTVRSGRNRRNIVLGLMFSFEKTFNSKDAFKMYSLVTCWGRHSVTSFRVNSIFYQRKWFYSSLYTVQFWVITSVVYCICLFNIYEL